MDSIVPDFNIDALDGAQAGLYCAAHNLFPDITPTRAALPGTVAEIRAAPDAETGARLIALALGDAESFVLLHLLYRKEQATSPNFTPIGDLLLVLGELLAAAVEGGDPALVATIGACDEVLLRVEKTVHFLPPNAQRDSSVDTHMSPGTDWVKDAVRAVVDAAAAKSGWDKLGRAVARAVWAISIYADSIRNG